MEENVCLDYAKNSKLVIIIINIIILQITIYEPKARSIHCTEIIERKVYCWGGYQKDLPAVHDSKEKRLFLSVIEVFDIETGKSEYTTNICRTFNNPSHSII